MAGWKSLFSGKGRYLVVLQSTLGVPNTSKAASPLLPLASIHCSLWDGKHTHWAGRWLPGFNARLKASRDVSGNSAPLGYQLPDSSSTLAVVRHGDTTFSLRVPRRTGNLRRRDMAKTYKRFDYVYKEQVRQGAGSLDRAVEVERDCRWSQGNWKLCSRDMGDRGRTRSFLEIMGKAERGFKHGKNITEAFWSQAPETMRVNKMWMV